MDQASSHGKSGNQGGGGGQQAVPMNHDAAARIQSAAVRLSSFPFFGEVVIPR